MIDWDKHVLAPTESVFGQPAVYTAAGAGPIPIEGVFDEAYREVDLIDTGVGANAVMPVIGVRVNQFARLPKQGELIEIPAIGKEFVIKDVRTDGHGWAKLMLGFKRAL
jgi:hypothetical protein